MRDLNHWFKDNVRELNIEVLIYAESQVAPAIKSLNRLDAWIHEHYREILKMKNQEDYVPSSTDALYLYGRSFFLKDQPIAKPHDEAINFFLAQSRRHWLKVANRQSQGQLAIALQRWGGDANHATARGIMTRSKNAA